MMNLDLDRKKKDLDLAYVQVPTRRDAERISSVSCKKKGRKANSVL